MRLSQLFYRCVHRAYLHAENAADYAVDRVGDVLYVYLECSNGIEDWKTTWIFPRVRTMGRGAFRGWHIVALCASGKAWRGTWRGIFWIRA